MTLAETKTVPDELSRETGHEAETLVDAILARARLEGRRRAPMVLSGVRRGAGSPGVGAALRLGGRRLRWKVRGLRGGPQWARPTNPLSSLVKGHA
jgi:hypothetical protein